MALKRVWQPTMTRSLWVSLAGAMMLPIALGAPKADSILQRISEKGNQVVMDEFAMRVHSSWDEVVEGVKSGTDDWLRIYEKLAPVADGSFGEELDWAMTDFAFPRQHLSVFNSWQKLHPKVTAREMCTFEFLVSVPPGGIKIYLDSLDSSLGKISERSAADFKQICLKGVAEARIRFARCRAFLQDPSDDGSLGCPD
jgi:hypothetical protein